MSDKKKLIRLTAHSQTLGLLKGQIGFIGKKYEVVLVAKDTGNLKELAKQEGVRFRDVDMHREISIKNDLKSLFSLFKLFKKEQPHIVHANTPKGALLGLLAAKLSGVKHRIYNVNGLRFETASGKFRKLLIIMEKLACACATKVIPQSNGVAEVLRKEKITKKPLKVILNGSGNGVDIDFFNPEDKSVKLKAKEIKGDFSGISFVFIGRLVGDKGVNELIEAFDELNKLYSNIRLYLVGGKEQNLDPLAKKTIEMINENPNILAVGSQNDVRPYLSASNIFVLPSYREGFPNVVLEAQAMGLPVIVTEVNGATDVIKDGVNGFVIPKKNSHLLYNAMKRMLDDNNLRKEMASKSRKIVSEKFNRPDVWKATLDMYHSLEI